MKETGKQTLVQALITTAVAVNLMLAAMILVREHMELPAAAPATAQPSAADHRTEYRMEPVGTTQEGDWRVEHYRQVELRYDKQGRLVERQPTTEKVHLRYWNPK